MELMQLIGSTLLLIAYMGLLFWLAQLKKRGSKKWFYIALYAPYIPAMIAVVMLGSLALIGVFGWWVLVVLLVIAAERVLWGMTVYEVAAQDKLITFVLVFLVPVFGWLIYRATQWR